MEEWKDPKNDYTAASPVTPEIFNTLSTNEKHLKEISCHVELQPKSGDKATVNAIVLVEV